MIDCVKYIEVGDAVKILCHDCIRYVFPTTAEPTTEFIKLNNAINLLQLYPSADVEPVVRCKDCMYSETDAMGFYYCINDIIGGYGATLDADTFCSYGERKHDEID